MPNVPGMTRAKATSVNKNISHPLTPLTESRYLPYIRLNIATLIATDHSDRSHFVVASFGKFIKENDYQ